MGGVFEYIQVYSTILLQLYFIFLMLLLAEIAATKFWSTDDHLLSVVMLRNGHKCR